MKRFPFFLIVSFLLCLSCVQKKDIQRDVFLGMKLGSSTTEAENKFLELIKQGTLKVHDGRLPYYLNSTYDRKNYYSAPIYFSNPGDTIVTTIKVVYCDNLDYLKQTAEDGIKGWNYMNLHTLPQNSLLVSANEIWDDISFKLEKKYGKCDGESEINHKEITNKPFITKCRIWKNRNDVNIELNFLENTNDRGNMAYGGNSRIFLEYRYIDEINDKLTKGKSEY